MRLDGLKGLFQVVGGGVGWESLDDTAWGGLLEIGADAVEALLAAGEECNG